MDNNYLLNLTKAAKAGMSHYAPPDDWHKAITEIAKTNRQPGETAEQAEARLTRDDPTVRKLDQMRREALATADVQKAKGGRPRKYSPQGVTVTKAENRLFDLAKAQAQRNGTSFEQAFVRVIDTPEGRELYRETRGAIQ